MKKSLYSLMLADSVIREIDKLAYAEGTNRSNMINQILAQHVSYVTPERRAKTLLAEIAGILPVDTFKIIDTRSDFFFSVCSPLAYKYNPTVKYTLAVTKNQCEDVGELRVSVRSSSEALLKLFDAFFTVWQNAEFAAGGDVRWRAEPFRYSKELIYKDGEYSTGKNAGDDVAAYISYLDKAIKQFFSRIEPYFPETSLAAAGSEAQAVFEGLRNGSGAKFR